MARPIPRHGASIYLVSEKSADSAEDELVPYGANGRLSESVAKFDRESWKIVWSGAATMRTEFDAREQPAPKPYRRYFGFSPRTSGLLRNTLNELGQAMRSVVEANTDLTDIPAAYTYLGQFIFHDLTFMRPGQSKLCPDNERSAPLDLDSLFNPPTAGPAVRCPAHVGEMAVGCTAAGEALDLPRTTIGEPVIGEGRNDSNLSLAQIHMLMLRFYNAVARACGDSAKARELTKLHFQSVVLHDYLQRLIDPTVYKDVEANGRAIILPSSNRNSWRGEDYLLPLEFAAACGRFGHSMVRYLYPWTNGNYATVDGFWEQTYNSSIPHRKQISVGWNAPWQTLAGIDLPPSETIMAAKLGTRFASPLLRIRTEALEDDFDHPNLASRSLMRGDGLQLSSGQEVARCVNRVLGEQGRPTFEILTDEEKLLRDENSDAQQIMKASGLVAATPLWFYILKEAEVLSCGMRLGPLGSRIVLETLHAAIEKAAPSIIGLDGKISWHPDPRLCPAHDTHYSFADLIRLARVIPT